MSTRIVQVAVSATAASLKSLLETAGITPAPSSINNVSVTNLDADVVTLTNYGSKTYTALGAQLTAAGGARDTIDLDELDTDTTFIIGTNAAQVELIFTV